MTVPVQLVTILELPFHQFKLPFRECPEITPHLLPASCCGDKMETKHSQFERKFDLREKASGTLYAKILQVEGDNHLKLITLAGSPNQILTKMWVLDSHAHSHATASTSLPPASNISAGTGNGCKSRQEQKVA